MNMLENQNAIDFIPHAKPMVFVDHICEIGDNFAVAELTIHSDLMFCDPNGLPTWSSIELMAQTVSLYAGFKGKAENQENQPKIGFLLGTRKLNLPIPYFTLGESLIIRAEQQYLHEGLGQFACEILYQDHTISAMLSVYEPEDHQKLIK